MSQLKDRAGMLTDEVSERGLQTWQQTDEKPYELHTGDGEQDQHHIDPTLHTKRSIDRSRIQHRDKLNLA